MSRSGLAHLTTRQPPFDPEGFSATTSFSVERDKGLEMEDVDGLRTCRVQNGTRSPYQCLNRGVDQGCDEEEARPKGT